MNINGLVPTPDEHSEFTLESLGLATHDQLNKDGVLGLQGDNAPSAVIHQPLPGGEGETSMNPDEIAQMPDWNIKLVSVYEGTKHVVDMADIQKDIEGTDSMDGDKAKALNATLEGVGSPTFPAHTFTSFPSRTGVAQAKARLGSVIQKTCEALLTQFREAQPDAIAGLVKDVDTAKEYCIYDLRDRISDAVNKISAVREDLKKGPIMLPFNGDLFLDMTSTNLIDVDIDQLKQGVPISAPFRLAFADMKEAWTKKAAVREISKVLAHLGRHTDEGEVPVGMGELYVKTLSHVFKDETAGDFSELAKDRIAAVGDEISQGFDALPENLTPGIQTTDIIGGAAKDLLNRAEKLDYAKKDVESFAKFAEDVVTVLVGLTSLR